MIQKDAKGIELRIVQMKLVEEDEKRKHSMKMEDLRHNNVMKELEFMAKHNINSFSVALSDKQIMKLRKQVFESNFAK